MTSRTSGRDSLTIEWIGYIASSKDTWNIGGCGRMLDLDISCLITFYGMTEYLGVWMMSDGKEETVDIDVETLFMISALASHAARRT